MDITGVYYYTLYPDNNVMLTSSMVYTNYENQELQWLLYYITTT